MLKFVGKDLIELIPKLNHKFTIQNIFINMVVVVVVPCNDMVDKRHKNVTNRLTYLSVRDFCNLVNINRAIFGKMIVMMVV